MNGRARPSVAGWWVARDASGNEVAVEIVGQPGRLMMVVQGDGRACWTYHELHHGRCEWSGPFESREAAEGGAR